MSHKTGKIVQVVGPVVDVHFDISSSEEAGLLPKLPADKKARVRLKSGSMDGVLCYSGYILDEAGKPKFVFSLMVNGATAKTAVLRDTLGSLIEGLL